MNSYPNFYLYLLYRAIELPAFTIMAGLLNIILSLNIYFIQFGTGLCLLACLIDVLRSRRLTHRFFLAFILASIQLRIGLYGSGVVLSNPYLIFLFVTSVFCLGPLILIFADHILELSIFKGFKPAYHFIPAALVFLMELTLLFFLKTNDVQAQIFDVVAGPDIRPAGLLLLLGCVHELLYLGYTALAFIKAKHKYDLEFSHMALTVSTGPFIALLLFMTGLMFRVDGLFFIASIFFTGTIAAVFYYSSQKPESIESIRGEIHEKKYVVSQLEGQDVESLKAKLTSLMEELGLYRDEDLTIHKLAADMNISYKQLSELINGVYGQNFSQYINSYRITKAMELLNDDRKASILSVAFAVGFNNKTTFNSQFKKLTGKTPSEFRRQVGIANLSTPP